MGSWWKSRFPHVFTSPASSKASEPAQKPRATRVDRLSKWSSKVPDQRDDLQRVALGAQVAVWEISEDGLSKTETMKAEIESGQLAELKWCHSGSALLVHCTTEVDDTGKSYYGVSKLRCRPDSARSSAPCMARERLKML